MSTKRWKAAVKELLKHWTRAISSATISYTVPRDFCLVQTISLARIGPWTLNPKTPLSQSPPDRLTLPIQKSSLKWREENCNFLHRFQGILLAQYRLLCGALKTLRGQLLREGVRSFNLDLHNSERSSIRIQHVLVAEYPICEECHINSVWQSSNRDNIGIITMSGRFLGIIGWDPSVSKSNWLHLDIFRFFFIHLRFILWNPLSRWVVFLKFWISPGYLLNSTGSCVTTVGSPRSLIHHLLIWWQQIDDSYSKRITYTSG